MKLYRIHQDRPVKEILEVTTETELGVHVKITSCSDQSVQEYWDFLSYPLFEALLKNGALENFDVAASAS